MIERESQNDIFNLLKQFPAVGILGPRQIGKTTLAFQIAEKISPEPIYLDLESPSDAAQLSEPELYFNSHSDRTIILDEIQRTPEIFAVLRGVIDKRRRAGQKSGQFLILGSASLDLLQQSSESLAGRIAYIRLTGLKATEIDKDNIDKLWLRGGFPESFLAENNSSSFEWRQNLITTYLERDIPQLGFRISAAVLRNFWTMLANVQGGISNMSRIAAGLGISVPTANRYLDLLEDLFLVRKLQPWSVNAGKRLVRTPKIYIRDSGITHTLLKIRNQDDLLGHPVLGGSWEGFIIENLLSVLPDWVIPYYYRTAAGAEIDLVLEINHQTRIAIEIKRSLTPAVSKGFSTGCEDIQATHKYFVFPGKNSYMISGDVKVVPLIEMMDVIRKIIDIE
ncbi:ATP-binding protein [Dyadobacter flavalbus]|uniref:ATP-binding protein n=1 Tax=Dyadobacter flavalbus TaxID=2579942 RepID=A0A5M8QVY5_9BACT|nr:ATP-binding protein [Dyadobacter flavalbus]KAA6440319.1 ATP-binding protein [Dyadobacter flavalbus]